MAQREATFIDRALACAAAKAWVDSSTKASMENDAASGFLDSQLFFSGCEGFTWAFHLAARPDALSWALDAGWSADRPCLFKSHGARVAEWRLFEVAAYELAPGMPDRVPLATLAECIRVLGAAGFSMADRNPCGESALHGVAMKGSIADESYGALTRAILAHDRRVDLEDGQGQTPLHVARGAESMSALLLAGASHHARDLRGRRAIDAALSRPEGPAAFAIFEQAALRGAAREAAERPEAKRI